MKKATITVACSLKDFAQELVGTANSWAKEGRRCAKIIAIC